MNIRSKLDSFFKLNQNETTIKTEIFAGLTTFLSMAYIIMVNPDILSQAHMPQEAVVIATCLISGIATITVGILGRFPIAMAPGMGLNLFFAYTLVMGHKISWETALGAVFLSGLFFTILSILGVRDHIVRSLPPSIIDAVSGGIGLYIALTGLRRLGLTVTNPHDLLDMSNLSSMTIIGLFGLLVIVVLEVYHIKGSIIFGIVAATVTGMISGYVKIPPSFINLHMDISPVFLKLDILGALKWSFAGTIFTLMFIDMFDSLATVMACSYQAGKVKKDGTIEKLRTILTVDAASTMLGAVLGTSTTTSYVESASGIESGGRTGLTSVVTGLLFLLALPFYPFIAMVPKYATAPALIIVGMILMRRIKHIDYSTMEEGFPPFITILMMPSASSISVGLAYGFISYAIIKIIRGKIRDMNPIMWVVTALSVLCLVL